MAFVHLHLHTKHSLLDALGSPKDVCEAACRCGMKSVAISEHGNLSSVPELYAYSKKNGIKPIYAVEAYFTENDLETGTPAKGDYSHLLLLAQTFEGYKNICELTSIANTKGMFSRPRISWAELERYNKGIIATSACLGGVINKHLLNDDEETALRNLHKFNEIFRGRFYLELQRHGSAAPELIKTANPALEKYAKQFNIPLVVTNDSHFLCRNDKDTHKILIAKAHHKKLSQSDYDNYYDDSFYFKNEQEMLDLFPDNTIAVHNSGEIADMIEEFDIQAEEYNLPKALIDGNRLTEEEAYENIKRTCEKVLNSSIDINLPEYHERFVEELAVIKDFRFCNYLLLVSEEIKWARENGIPVGPGRGSSANCLVNYLLGITRVDPIKYNLDFARFLNKGRLRVDDHGKVVYSSMIDIDTDISKTGRKKFLNHIKEKYGNVYYLGINQRFTAKTALKAVGTAMGVSATVMHGLTKSILEKEPGTDERVSIEFNLTRPTVQEYIAKNKLESIIKPAQGLEDGITTVGVHASGFIISENPIESTCPVRGDKKFEFPITMFNMKAVETLTKQIKFDFLGLKELSVIEHTENLIRKENPDFVPPDPTKYLDQDVLNAERGLDEIFQLTGVGGKYYNAIKPTTLEEIADVIAMIRPGTLTSGWADKYVAGGFRHKIKIMNDLLKSTKGILIYQEQLMEVAKTVGGFDSMKADELRSACGKKNLALMNSLLAEFEAGAIANGYTKEEIDYISQQMKDAGKYSFNKGHAISYACITYVSLWYKHYYPVEFYTGVLNSYQRKADEIALALKNVAKNNIPIAPPDINVSDVDFTCKDGKIYIGLSGIKGISKNALDMILEQRPFDSLKDLNDRTIRRIINKKVRFVLASAGALDSLEPDRNESFRFADSYGPYNDDDLAYMQMDVTGRFFGHNPHINHKCFINANAVRVSNLLDCPSENPLVIGFLNNITHRTSSSNKNEYITAILSDGIDEIPVCAFSTFINKSKGIFKTLTNREPVIIGAKMKLEGESPEVLGDYKLLMFASASMSVWVDKGIRVRLLDKNWDSAMESLFPGDISVTIYTLGGKESKENIDKDTLNKLTSQFGGILK